MRSENPGTMPLLMPHGWPGSNADLLLLVGPLTDPVAHGGAVEDSFDVVVSSLPGFGFSGKPTATGWTLSPTAGA